MCVFDQRRSMALFGAVLAVLCLKPGIGRAEPTNEEGPDDEFAPPTFSYETAAGQNYLRAVIEFEAVFAVGLLYYVTTTDRNWDLGYRWETYEQKFHWDAFGIDQNHFGTNFIGHPLGGAGYYAAARSNRLSAFESFAFSFAGSLLWEYFGEITERVSLNDTVVTPTAGVAIGEATTQLGAFFDRSSPTSRNRILGVAFAPFKSFNDWADGLELKRARHGWATREWHRFDLEAGGVVVSGADAPLYGGVEVRLGSRLARLPDYDGPGRHSSWFSDGNVSEMDFALRLSDQGLSDVSFLTRVMLAGYYFRDAHPRRDRVSGGGVVIGPTTAFEYSLHDYGASGGPDRISYVQPLALSLLHRVALGSATLATDMHAGPGLGGLNAHAHEAYTGSSELLPEVLRLHRYYFGVGGMASVSALLDYRGLELGAAMSVDGYEVIQDRLPSGDVPIRDVRAKTSARLGFNFPRTPAFIRVRGEHLLRSGAMGEARAESRELTSGLSLGGVF
jgi:hypothetical protein